MRFASCLIILGAMLVLSMENDLCAAPAIELELVTGGLASPVDIQHAGDGSDRIFIAERDGRIRIFEDGALIATPFLDIRSQVLCCGERGLLGIAFHPSYASNGWFFVNYTIENPDPVMLPGVSEGDTLVARYRVTGDPNVADPGSEEIVLTIPQPASNHNGGQIQFGPDGYLYIASGDGGGGGDPSDNGQSLNTLLGKILRLDVDAGAPYAIPASNPFVSDPAALDEIWAYGLRNPWRFSFDRVTGEMFIADVGQGSWEEVSLQAAASAGGENYGWRCREGAHDFNTTGCGGKTFVDPILEYSHSDGCSITGGYSYRGYASPELLGFYLYGDFCSGRIWGAHVDGSDWTSSELLPSSLSIATFGEDENGELYVADLGGEIYKIITTPTDELTVDLGAEGLWHYEPDTWTNLTSWNPETLTRWEDKLAVQLGSEGLWLYEGSSWQGLTSWSPYAIAPWRGQLLAAFDAGRGLFLYDATGWRELTSWEPELVIAWGDAVAVDFGPGRGLWLYDGASFRVISSWSPERLLVHGPDLIAAFGAGRGLWRFHADSWSQLATWDPYDLVSWNGQLVAAFDTGRGTFVHDGSSWAQLTIWEPVAMKSFGDRLALAFPLGSGLWAYDPSGWTPLTSWDAVRLETRGSDLTADFGDGRGLWLYELGSWRQITVWSSEGIASVDLF